MKYIISNLSNQSGYVALLGTIILSAISLAITVTLLVSATDNQRSSLVSQQSIQARALSNSCAEEAMQIIRDDTVYTGGRTLTFGTGTCSYTVTDTGNGTREIRSTGNAKENIRKIKISVIIGATSISISSWQEVSDF